MRKGMSTLDLRDAILVFIAIVAAFIFVPLLLP